MMNKLAKHSKEILMHLEWIEKRYIDGRKENKKADFFDEVKPYADKVKKELDVWQEEALLFLQTKATKKLWPMQINSAYDQIETCSIQAFYPETSKSRFTNQLQSAKFVVETLLRIVEESEV